MITFLEVSPTAPHMRGGLDWVEESRTDIVSTTTRTACTERFESALWNRRPISTARRLVFSSTGLSRRNTKKTLVELEFSSFVSVQTRAHVAACRINAWT